MSGNLKLKNINWNEREKQWRGTAQKGDKTASGRGETALLCAQRLNFNCEKKGIPLPNPSVGKKKPLGQGRRSKVRVIENPIKEETPSEVPSGEIRNVEEMNLRKCAGLYQGKPCVADLHPIWNTNYCGTCGTAVVKKEKN